MRIYLDHNATAPVRDEVARAMTRALREYPGNPSSPHAEGAAARAAREQAREQVARLIGAAPAEIVFTSGATEANNTALALADPPGVHVVSTRVEHPSVDEPLCELEASGARVTRVAVDGEGRVDRAALAAAVGAGTCLVSVIAAHNETGVLQPVGEISALVRARGALLHVDATQALGRIPIDVAALGVDLLAGSAHKLGGPKGVGFLFARRGVELRPLLRGGPQERRRRAGTENLAGIVGLGAAAALVTAELPHAAARLAALRDRLWDGIAAKVPRVRRNGSAVHVLPNTLNVEFEGASGEVLVEALDLEGIAAASGAACASGSTAPSASLLAMGRTPEQARACVRFSVGHGNDEAQIDAVLAVLPDLVARAREASAS